MYGLYGNAGYRTFVSLLSLQLFIFIGLFIVSVVPIAVTISNAPFHVFAFWILIGALAGFVNKTWSALTEAAFCLGFLTWKRYTTFLRPILLLSPVALIATDVLRHYGVTSAISRLPLLIISIMGILASAFALYMMFYFLRGFRWRNRMYNNILSRVIEKFGTTDTRRLIDSIDYERGISRNNPFQMKRGFILADVPSSAWYSESEFLWKEAFMRVADKIRAEAMKVCFEHALNDYNYVGHVEGRWKVFWLVRGGRVYPSAETSCPETLQALRQVPGFPNMGEAHFSVLKPHSRILPHCDESNMWITAHFGIDIPEECGIRVGRETRRWKENEFLFFDTTYEHEVWNNSDRPRIILLFGFLNPALNKAEQEFAISRERGLYSPVFGNDR